MESNKYRVLVVWEFIPGVYSKRNRFYLLENLNKEELKKVKKAHEVIVNSSLDDSAAIWLEEFLKDKKRIKVKQGKPIKEKINLIVHSGFAL